MIEAQWRAARALVGWSQGDLAQKIGASVLTIKRLEADVQSVSDEMKARAREALELAGVEFTNGREPGVRMNKLHKFLGEVRAAAVVADGGDMAVARSVANNAYQAYLEEIKAFAANEANSIDRSRTLLSELAGHLMNEADRQTAAGRELVEMLKGRTQDRHGGGAGVN